MKVITMSEKYKKQKAIPKSKPKLSMMNQAQALKDLSDYRIAEEKRKRKMEEEAMRRRKKAQEERAMPKATKRAGKQGLSLSEGSMSIKVDKERIKKYFKSGR